MDFEVYHVFSKSIAGFKIFNNEAEFQRMRDLFWYYQIKKPQIRFSWFKELDEKDKQKVRKDIALKVKEKLVDIIAYCCMPTHVHLILQQKEEKNISCFMSNVLNSYTRYFNIKHNRKGPLWEGRFKRVLIESDEQLLHVTRYIHLNPVTAYLVRYPQEWFASSYREYIKSDNSDNAFCDFSDKLELSPDQYRIFAEDQISYQRDLARIKDHLFDRSYSTS